VRNHTSCTNYGLRQQGPRSAKPYFVYELWAEPTRPSQCEAILRVRTMGCAKQGRRLEEATGETDERGCDGIRSRARLVRYRRHLKLRVRTAALTPHPMPRVGRRPHMEHCSLLRPPGRLEGRHRRHRQSLYRAVRASKRHFGVIRVADAARFLFAILASMCIFPKQRLACKRLCALHRRRIFPAPAPPNRATGLM